MKALSSQPVNPLFPTQEIQQGPLSPNINPQSSSCRQIVILEYCEYRFGNRWCCCTPDWWKQLSGSECADSSLNPQSDCPYNSGL